MKTHYKPTQWRGKRVVFASIDPAEQKREARNGWIVLTVFLLFIVGVLLLQVLGLAK